MSRHPVHLPGNRGDIGLRFVPRGTTWRLELIEAPLEDWRDADGSTWSFAVEGVTIAPEQSVAIADAGLACCARTATERTVELMSGPEGPVQLTFVSHSDTTIVGHGKAALTVSVTRRALRSLDVTFVVDPSCLVELTSVDGARP